MLNKNTKAVLSALSAINTQAIISYPITGIKMGNNVQAFFDMEKLGEEAFEEFGIFNIPELLSTVSVIGDDATITMNAGVMTIANNNSSIRYGTTNIGIIEDECRTKTDMVERIKGNENVVNFELPQAELEKLKKVSGVLKDLTDLSIETADESVVVTAQGKEKSSNNIAIKLNAEVLGEVSLKIVMANINKLPNGSYNVSIYKSAKGSLITLFQSQGVDGLNIVIAAK